MKVLNIVKTNHGAKWAFEQARWLHENGVEVITVLPNTCEGYAKKYSENGILVVSADLSFPITKLWRIASKIRSIRKLVRETNPDIIHCHFVTNILMIRIALRKSVIPRLFQVPGPLHLEHWLFRKLELLLSNDFDYWAGACKKTCEIYKNEGIKSEKLFLAYYGGYGGEVCDQYLPSKNLLHNQYDLSLSIPIIGMVSYFYKPKPYIFQTRGIKGHEDFIDAIAIVKKDNPDIKGIIIGGAWQNSGPYEQKLIKYAQKKCGDSIIFAGFRTDLKEIYKELHIAVHPSHSENLGAAAESLAAGVPTISTNVGGFPDIVINGRTGYTVSSKSPEDLANKIVYVLKNYEESMMLAGNGQSLVRKLLDLNETSKTVLEIYQTMLVGNKT